MSGVIPPDSGDPSKVEGASLRGGEPALSDPSGPRDQPPTVAFQAGDTQIGSSTPAGGEALVEFGRYTIVRRLGAGGMGDVYLARDTELDRLVALKMPHISGEQAPNVIERFYREARAAASFNHPNLCPVFDVGVINGRHYLTMPFVVGRPLLDYLRSGKTFPQRQIMLLIRKLAVALEYAHRHGAIHRDLKPSNIMMNEQREPVVVDFGLARRRSEDGQLTQSGSAVGTPAYMSPEQAHGDLDQIGPAADIYSLGVILYEMLTGRTPFQGDPLAMIAQIVSRDPPSPRTFRPEIDARLESICLRAISRLPNQRFASMKHFADALSQLLDSPSAISQGALSPEAKPTGAAPQQTPTAGAAAKDAKTTDAKTTGAAHPLVQATAASASASPRTGDSAGHAKPVLTPQEAINAARAKAATTHHIRSTPAGPATAPQPTRSQPAPQPAAPRRESPAPETIKSASPLPEAPHEGLVEITQLDELTPVGDLLAPTNMSAGIGGSPSLSSRPMKLYAEPSQQETRKLIILASAAGGGTLALLVLAIIVTSALRHWSSTDPEVAANPPANVAPSETAIDPVASPDAVADSSSGFYGDALPPGYDNLPTPAPRSTPLGPEPANRASPSTSASTFTPEENGSAFNAASPASTIAAPAEATNPLPVATATVDPASSDRSASGGPTLHASVLHWHRQPGASLRGARAVSDDDVVVQNYSWLCELLPHLGHEALYNRFRFDRSWTNEPNLQLTANLVPQFLNPADDRQRWRGYPFDGMALTHFVGMSGVEDRPNVVAASLPRSDPRAGVFGYHEVARQEQITDGASQTMMVLGSGELASPWVQGGGATVRGAREPYFDALTGFGTRGQAKPGVTAMFADGSVRRISTDIDPSVFRAMSTIHGADSVDFSQTEVVPGGFPVGN